MITLSICIATFGRGDFIAETLDTLIAQLTSKVEIIVVDGASPDNTSNVLTRYSERCPSLRYFRETTNSGADADFDKAVAYAQGTYCWLFPDDDLLLPGAIEKVLSYCADSPDLIVVDSKAFDVSMTKVLMEKRLPFDGLRRYDAQNADQLLADTGDCLSFIGAVIMHRKVWLDRDRKSYFGSLFIHIGVIFQQPSLKKVIAIGEPLIAIRYGNALWTPQRFGIWAFLWPSLIWGLERYSVGAKKAVVAKEPWRSLRHMVSFRAKGAYSLTTYREFFSDPRIGASRLMLVAIALLPGKVAHILGTIALRVSGRLDGLSGYDLFASSPYINPLSRYVARKASWIALPSRESVRQARQPAAMSAVSDFASAKLVDSDG